MAKKVEIMKNTRNVFILVGAVLGIFLLCAFVFLIVKNQKKKDKPPVSKKTIKEQIAEINSYIENQKLKPIKITCLKSDTNTNNCVCDEKLIEMIYSLYYNNNFQLDDKKQKISNISTKDSEFFETIDSNLVFYNVVLLFKNYMLVLKKYDEEKYKNTFNQQTTYMTNAGKCTLFINKISQIQDKIQNIPSA